MTVDPRELQGRTYDAIALARVLMLDLKDIDPSRELSIAITELETAMLWFEQHTKYARLRVQPGDTLTTGEVA